MFFFNIFLFCFKGYSETLSDFKNEIENMSEEEKETEKTNEMVDIVEMIKPKEVKD